MRRLISSFGSSRPLFEVTRPRTTVLSFGSIRNGSKPPARAVSYSMKKPWTLILLNRISWTVAARTHVGGLIIAAAHVHGDRHVGRNVRHRGVDEIAVQLA